MFKVLSIIVVVALAWLFPIVAGAIIILWVLSITLGLKNTKVHTDNGDITVDLASTRTVASKVGHDTRIGIQVLSELCETSYIHAKHQNTKVDLVTEALGLETTKGFKDAEVVVVARQAKHKAKIDDIKAKQLEELAELKAKYGIK